MKTIVMDIGYIEYRDSLDSLATTLPRCKGSHDINDSSQGYADAEWEGMLSPMHEARGCL